MEHFPPKDTVFLTAPEIPPHLAAQSAGNGVPYHASSSQRSTAEETALGKDNNGQDHSRQLEGTNAALWHEVSNSPTPPQKAPQRANKLQSPPPRTQITYPTLPPSPPSVPASEQKYPHLHHSNSYMCPTQDCGWKVAYLKLRSMTKKLMEEREEDVRGLRWAVDDIERMMHSNAETLDELDGGWRGYERAPDVEEGAGEALRGKVARGFESSTGDPPRDGGTGVPDQVVYPDLRSDLSRLEREEDRLGSLQGMGGMVACRGRTSAEAPSKDGVDRVLDRVVYPGLRSHLSRLERDEDRLRVPQGMGGEVARGVEPSAGVPPQDGGNRLLGRVKYPDLPSVIFGGETVVDRLA